MNRFAVLAVNPNPIAASARKLRASALLAGVFALGLLLLAPSSSFAQTGGQGALEGTISDPTGAVIPKATVTATEQAGKDAATRQSSGAGLYSITPLVPGVYTITVKAAGFETLTQKNIEVNGLTVTGLNLKMTIGSTDQSVTVTEAPPQLQTTTAQVISTITQDTYESLPIVLNNQQRDPSALATLAPGTQGGSRAPLFAGTGNYLSEVYVDGLPTTTSNQQSDNRVVSNGIPVESVEQLQIISSGPSAEYQGAGAIGFSIKTGGNKYHGQVIDFVRNTAFDTWGFAGNQVTTTSLVNGVLTTAPGKKPVEHQNELSVSVGGPIKFTRGKGFFFVNYDKYHGRTGVQPIPYTVPTTLMTLGDFTDLNAYFLTNGTTAQMTAYHDPTNVTGAFLYNPLTNSCNPSGSTCSRMPYQGVKNGLPTYNILPSSALSPISQYEQKFLPAPNLTSAGIYGNYFAGGLSGFDNHELLFNVAFDLPKTQRINFIYSHGVRGSVGYGANLPLPYTEGDSSAISPTLMEFEHSISIGSNKVNQFKYGFTRFPQPVYAPTDGLSTYRATDAGITGLPAGQASGNFPCSQFVGAGLFPNYNNTYNSAGASVQSEWTQCGASDSSHNVVPNAFTIVDNFQWSKGRHNMTFGLQTQWLEDNTIAQSSPSGIYTQSWNPISTANFSGNTLSSATTGYAYASFLIGAVNSAATSVPLFQETAGRFHNYSPYFQDDWKVTPTFTLNLGLRWDYFPPFHEAQDHISFFNPNVNNPITGTAGELQFAGNPGAGLGCNCHTPVNTYWKNFGPRLGAEWAVDTKTVFRAGFAVAYSKAGGVGGRAGDSTGTGQTGFGSNIVLNPAVNQGIGAAPSFYLNTNPGFVYNSPTGDTFANAPNSNFGGPGYVIPNPSGPSASSLLLGIGNFNNGTSYSTASGAPGYADPYLSGRAPEFVFYNFGMQKALTNAVSLTLQYSGSQSHFVSGAGVPGFWSGQLNPSYLPLLGSTVATDGVTPILGAPANPANVALTQAAYPGYTLPYAGYQQAAGGTSTTGSIARALRPFPQYSSPPSPTWDNIGNISYNAFELVLAMREYKGVNFTVNYTFSRNVGDDGTTRSAFPVPAAASSSGTALPGNNRADRDLVATDLPENLNIYGVAKSPFGRNKMGGNNWAVRTFAGGWQAAGVFTYASGTPILVTGTGCNTPSAGTCMPDLVPGRKNSIRINGGYGGPGVTYANYSTVNYLDSTAFQQIGYFPLPAPPAGVAANLAPITKIGSAPRSSLNLWSPSHYNLDMAAQRSFNVIGERVKFIFRADCFDVSNKVTFGLSQGQTVAAYTPPAAVAKGAVPNYIAPGTPDPVANFGRLNSASGNRRFQFSGRVTF